jgi:hypothetical protein
VPTGFQPQGEVISEAFKKIAERQKVVIELENHESKTFPATRLVGFERTGL